jgi:hypothetical protein
VKTGHVSVRMFGVSVVSCGEDTLHINNSFHFPLRLLKYE